MNKKILWIGDLRTAMNYGAVATSEALRDLLNTSSNIELRCIDSRSFFKETPIDGWEETSDAAINSKIEKHFKRKKINANANIVPVKAITNVDFRSRYFVPLRWCEYDEFTKKVIEGKLCSYERKMIEWADEVVVNSEGNIVHGTDRFGAYRMGGLYLLFIEYLSKIVFGKKTYVINHSVDPANMDAEEIIKNVYSKLDGICVRERYSKTTLASLGINEVKIVPDALFSHNYEHNNMCIPEFIKTQIDTNQEYVCVGDSSAIKNNFSNVTWDVKKFYYNLICELKKKYKQVIFIDGFGGGNPSLNELFEEENIPNVNIYTCSHEELYWILKGASIFISGRWHASIISLMAHTPILLWGADSHKTRGLYDLVDYPYEFFDVKSLPINIDRIVAEANKIVSADHAATYSKVDSFRTEAQKNVQMLMDEN